MRSYKSYLPFVFVLIPFVLLYQLTGCAVNPVTGQTQFMLITEEEEIKMGKELYPSAIWDAEGGGGEYEDNRLKPYLGGIVYTIHKVSHRPYLPVQFAIQNSSVPNAWAIPGYVVITRGLLAGLESEAEFSFVMGHEIGHVAARHSASQMSHGMLHQLLLRGVGIGFAQTGYSDAALALGSIGSNLLLLKYSRDDELEADRLGVLYMARLGYNPENALKAHKNLEKVSNEYLHAIGKDTREGGFFTELLSTHPRTAVRIEEIKNIIRNTPRYPIIGDGTQGERFKSMVADLKDINRLYVDYYDKAVSALNNGKIEEATRLISKAMSINPSQAPFYALRGFIMVKKKAYDDAEGNFSQALLIDHEYQPAIRGIGVVRYLKGDYVGSIAYLKKGLGLFPNDMASHYFLGMSYYKTGAYGNAISYLKRFTDTNPNHPAVYGVLGICYEAIGDEASAYNAYRRQLKVAPNNEMGKRAATRVRLIERRLR